MNRGGGIVKGSEFALHFHLVSVPEGADSLSKTMQRVLGPYAIYFNRRHGLCGRLWQGRFFSCVLDSAHFWAAIRYVELTVRVMTFEGP